MYRQTEPIAIEEHGGRQYSALADAQLAALRPLAVDLVDTIRGLLAAGVLAVDGGRVVVNERPEGPANEP